MGHAMRALLLTTTVFGTLFGLALPHAAMAAPMTMADAAPPVPQGKLADAITPAAYRLDLTVDPAAGRFSGHVEIDAKVNAPSRFVYIHGRDLAVHTATATFGGRTITGSWQQVDPTGVALLTFAEPLPAGNVRFAFDYDAAFQDGPAGLFHVKVGDKWYGWSQFESIDARAAYPGFDQPGYKQPFTVTLRTPTGLMAVSNAPETGVTQEGGMDVHHFAQTLPLPTYLLALMVGPFADVAGAIPPTPQRDRALPLRIVSTQQNAGSLAFALDNTKPIIAHLENYFGQSFPYPKLDLITAPIMPGAMENAGADLFQDGILVMDGNAATPQKREFGMIVSHELAHQWFGDLVTPAWWDDIWLNESFANWMGFRIGNEWRPDLNIGSGALAEGFAAMGTDALLAGRPIHQTIARNSQIDAAFDNITYGKGGQVVAMIAAYMGDTKFRDGVRAYMAAHRYGNGTSAEFFRAMAEVSGDPRILPAMQSFTDQQGVPLLTFAGSAGHYTVTQSRYVRLGTPAPDMRWGVPFCVRSVGGGERSCLLLDQPGGAITVGGTGALMPNAGGTGYYRFELPMAEWDRLIAASASLPGGEGLALSDSLTASFMAGRAHASQLAQLARVMVGNPDSYASDTAFAGLDYLDRTGMLDARASAAYRKLVSAKYRPMLAEMGFDPRAGAYASEAAERSLRRAQIVGRLDGNAHDPALHRQLAEAGKAWMAGDTKAVDPSWYADALGAWLGDGGMPAAKQLLDKALASQDPVLRPTALGVLAQSGKLDVAAWLLDDTKDKPLRQSERLRLVAGIATTRMTRDFAYDWIHAHLDTLLSGGGGIFFSSRLPQLLTSYCSTERADAMTRDFGARFAGKTGQLELDRAVERVRDCGMLKDARGAEASAEVARVKP